MWLMVMTAKGDTREEPYAYCTPLPLHNNCVKQITWGNTIKTLQGSVCISNNISNNISLHFNPCITVGMSIRISVVYKMPSWKLYHNVKIYITYIKM